MDILRSNERVHLTTSKSYQLKSIRSWGSEAEKGVVNLKKKRPGWLDKRRRGHSPPGS